MGPVFFGSCLHSCMEDLGTGQSRPTGYKVMRCCCRILRARPSPGSRLTIRLTYTPSPPDLWWSIGAGVWSGIPPPISQRLLTTQTPYKDGWSAAIPILVANNGDGFREGLN